MPVARFAVPALGALLWALAAPLAAQEAAFVVTLGKDTMAVERFTRTATKLTGELVSRFGAAGNRLQYEVTLGANGRPTMIVYRARPLSGTPAATAPREIRLTFQGDSVKREAVFADSTNTRLLPAVQGVPYQYPAFGLLEVAFAALRRSKATTATMAGVGGGGGTPFQLNFVVGSGDTVRMGSPGGLPIVYGVDSDGRVLWVDGSGTTQKVLARRGTPTPEIEALAARMLPAGPLSARGNASGSFLQSVVFINYGRPQARGRTVWNGLLIPKDTIWRLGANEATHFATSRELSFGSLTVPAGLYTLWLNNASAGPELIINKQVGQWGTSYDPAQDLGRVPLVLSPTPEHVEEFTITLRPAGQGRGAIDFAWGPQLATASFTFRPAP